MTRPGDQRFRRSERLRLRKDFARVFAARCSQADPALVVYVAANDLAWSRLGCSVSKKIGNAVCRNYVRRRMREAFRTQKHDLPRSLDIICIARPQASDKNWDLARSFRTLITQGARRIARTPPTSPSRNRPARESGNTPQRRRGAET